MPTSRGGARDFEPHKEYNTGPPLIIHVGYIAVTNHTCETRLMTLHIKNKFIFAGRNTLLMTD